MTRDGLVERNETTGEETRVSQRGQDFQLRTAPAEQADLGRGTSRDIGGGHASRPAVLQQEAVQEVGSHGQDQDVPPHSAVAPEHHGDGYTPVADQRMQSQPDGSEQAVGSEAPRTDSEHRDRPSRRRYGGAHDKGAESVPPRQRGRRPSASTKYHQQFTPEAAKPEAAVGGGASQTDTAKGTKLNFSPDERPPEPVGKKLTKARRKAERAGEKLEKARDNLPTRRKPTLAKEFDPDTGKMTRRLHFEKEVKNRSVHVKGPVALRPVHAVKNTGIGYAHKKLYEVQRENVGTEAAHKLETVAESGLRAGWRQKKTAPYRKVARLQRKATKTSMRAAYQQALHDNPKLKSNVFSRMWQRRKIRRQYAKAAREAKKAAKTAKRTGTVIGRAGQAAVALVKSHPAVFGATAGILLLVMVIFGMFSSCSDISLGSLGALLASTYLAEDGEIVDAELAYTEWETDLLLQVEHAEEDYPGYDEYRYNVDGVGHDPQLLMAYLTATYQDFRFADIQTALRQLFEEQYPLAFTPETETRYRDVPVYGADGLPTGAMTQEAYTWRILNITLRSRPFSDVLAPSISPDQQAVIDLLLASGGNRQYAGNPFAFDWQPYISDPFGWRIHPITGEKDFHKAADIAVPQGTPIIAAHDGIVTTATYHSSYGNYVALDNGSGLVTKYAHCSQLLVSAGQSVTQGDVIALVGSTGDSTGPHLHFEVIMDGEYLNPLYFAVSG